jgi:hypothetical protein
LLNALLEEETMMMPRWRRCTGPACRTDGHHRLPALPRLNHKITVERPD